MNQLTNTALLIVDVQNDYFPGGKSELHDPMTALYNIEALLRLFRTERRPVIHVRHINHREGAMYLLPDSDGSLIHERLEPRDGEPGIIKHFPNSFCDTVLLNVIRDGAIDGLCICGMMSHMCIDTTVRACKDYGLKVTLVEDACTTKELCWNGLTIPADIVHDVFMASLSGIFADVVKTDELVIE